MRSTHRLINASRYLVCIIFTEIRKKKKLFTVFLEKNRLEVIFFFVFLKFFFCCISLKTLFCNIYTIEQQFEENLYTAAQGGLRSHAICISQLIREPVQPFVQSVSTGCARCLYVPISVT